MKTIGASETKARFGKLLDRVMAGEEIVITRHDKPVARLISEGSPSRSQTERAVAGLEALQTEIAKTCAGKPEVGWEEFKSFVEAGRR